MQYFHGEDLRMVMEMTQILINEDDGVLEDQAPSQTLRPAGSAPGMSPVAEPAGSVLAAQGARSTLRQLCQHRGRLEACRNC